MKKKKYLYSLMLAAAAAAFSSCSNFLEEQPTDAFDEEEAFKSPNLVYLNAVANLYNDMDNIMGSDRRIYDLNTFSSDEAFLPCRIGDWEDGGLWQNLQLHRWGTMFELCGDSWEYLYEKVGLCNQSIEKLQKFANEQPDVEYFNTYMQEARAMRALYYYYLLDLFARVPLVTSTATQMSEVEQSSRSEVFNFVKTELEEALPYLAEERSNQSGEYYGRFTKPVGYFLLAKLALNAEVYTDDNWVDGSRPNGKDIKFTVDGTEVNAWEAVIKYVDKLGAMGYQLESDFKTNFSLNNENSVENIFTIPMDPTAYPGNHTYNITRTLHYTHAVAYGLNGWNGSCATKTAMKVFGYGTANPDPRLEMTYYTGAVYGPDGKQLMLDYNGESIPFEYAPMEAKVYMEAKDGVYVQTAGARMNKYELDENPGSDTDGAPLPHNDMVLFRYGDALLMKAEAKIRLGQSGDDEVNQIRNRVGAPEKHNVTLDDILDERMLELAWEGWRRQDQVRFGTFTQPTEDAYVGVEHSSSSLDYQIDATGYTTVFAIFDDILKLNPKLTQNPGY